MPTISVCNIVKNEEKQISGYLASLVDFADEIIIVDTGSVDKTIEIIESFVKKHNNIKFYKYTSVGVFHYGKAWNYAIKKSSKDFFIVLAADERLCDDFKNKVKQFLRDNNPDVVKVRWEDEIIPHLINYPERIVKNNLVIYYGEDEENRVHEQLKHNKKAMVFDGTIWHQQRWNHYIYRPHRILFQLELQIERTPKTKSLFGHILRGLWYFNFRFKKLYFKRKLYKDGKLGFRYAFMRAMDAFLVEFFVGLKTDENYQTWQDKKS